MKKPTKIIRIILIIIGVCLVSFLAMLFLVHTFLYSEQVVVVNDTQTIQTVSVWSIESDRNDLIKEEKQIKPAQKAVFNQVLSNPVCVNGMDFNSVKPPVEVRDQMKLELKARPFRTVYVNTFNFSALVKLAEKYPCSQK